MIFQVIHGILDRIMEMIPIPRTTSDEPSKGYYIEPTDGTETYLHPCLAIDNILDQLLSTTTTTTRCNFFPWTLC